MLRMAARPPRWVRQLYNTCGDVQTRQSSFFSDTTLVFSDTWLKRGYICVDFSGSGPLQIRDVCRRSHSLIKSEKRSWLQSCEHCSAAVS